MGNSSTGHGISHAQNMQLYFYSGSLSQEIMDSIILNGEAIIEQEEVSSKIKKRAIHIFYEIVQNLFRHSYKHLSDANRLLFSKYPITVEIIKNEHEIIINSRNPIFIAQKDSIQSNIDQIKRLTKEELDNFYKAKLDGGTFSEAGGAGLGLIDIARKSNQNINCKFDYLPDGLMFFKFTVKIELV